MSLCDEIVYIKPKRQIEKKNDVCCLSVSFDSILIGGKFSQIPLEDPHSFLIKFISIISYLHSNISPNYFSRE